MGWSIDTVKVELDAIFAGLKVRYGIQHVESTQASVMIRHEGVIPPTIITHIVALFPEFVYVNFVPNSEFAEFQETAELH